MKAAGFKVVSVLVAWVLVVSILQISATPAVAALDEDDRCQWEMPVKTMCLDSGEEVYEFGDGTRVRVIHNTPGSIVLGVGGPNKCERNVTAKVDIVLQLIQPSVVTHPKTKSELVASKSDVGIQYYAPRHFDEHNSKPFGNARVSTRQQGTADRSEHFFYTMDGPSNDPIGVPEIAVADSGPVNPSYRSDPPPPPPLAVDEGDVRPEGWWWLLKRTVGLEPASPGATHYFSVDGNRYYSIGEVYEPMASSAAIGRVVVARADTETIPGRYISPSAEHTRVEVYVRLYWWDGQRWQLQGWTRVCCNTETGYGDYDVDGRFWVPRQPGWWLKHSQHRIWRDGILQESRSHYQTEHTVWMFSYPVITWENQLNQWVCKCNPPCP